MKAWVIVPKEYKTLEEFAEIEVEMSVFFTRSMARQCKYLNEKVIKVEIKEIKK